ncbi:MAG: NAD(P)H-dependent glycerol-3-phosphate dehydrogenase [Prolixibacteraceae bacterium]|nr:NAD(P)H-dependent glycerol-3-phosphate dehydrogenase [Prolixibacteraceae bacterium]
MSFNTGRIGIIGSGSWATAIAKMLFENIDSVNWYFRKKETIELFKLYQHNPRYLQEAEFDTDKINFCNDINKLAKNSEILVLAVPSAFLPVLFKKLKIDISDKIIFSGIKGIVSEENLLIVEYLNKYFDVPVDSVGVIAGPCHAEEVALEQLSYLTIACQNESKATAFSKLINSNYISASTSDDIWGTEYASVLKNIMAIAGGIVYGLRYGDNFQAVLASNAIQEIKRFVDTVHPITRDIKSSAYLGDLLVTLYSKFSRNRMFGVMIGKGYSVKSAQLDMNMIAEGYFASKSIYEINQKYQVDMPICNAVYQILYEKATAKKEIKKLTALLS